MLDIQLIREKPEEVRAALARRGIDPPIDRILETDSLRRGLLTEVEGLKAERNRASKEIGKTREEAERQTRIQQMRLVGERIEALDAQVGRADEGLLALMRDLPNLPDPSVPDGPDDSANPVVRTVGEPKTFDFAPQPHWDLGPALGILDLERGVKMTGSRFYVLSGAGARLQRALIAWMLDLHIRQGYLEQYTPFLVREATLFAAGQLPKFVDNLYRDHEDDLWLVPTAEVPLTGLHMDEILDAETLPRRYTAYTPCFRREKMSAGRDVRGIKRGHQFDKVEMYIFCRPDDSPAELDRMLADAEAACAELGLAYRVKQLCAGDLGFSARKTYDLEVWAPGCAEWLEVSSVSNCSDFQARRANARFRRTSKARPEFLHTLNGSGLGLPRTLIAVLENYQQADGSVLVPDVLLPWMGGIERIGPPAT
ncbi:MAG: serine--tRNA ligase [Chloroflexi bacterium RBG_13_68_17]|nr:MAG: serine--tRNA ligase [Chloroflexi bacterium RBG_13_68_17]